MKIRVFNFLRKINIKYRLLITFLVTSILPLLLFSLYTYRLYSKSLEDKVAVSTSQMLALVNANMFTELEKYQYLCGYISINEKIQEALQMNNMTSAEKNRIILDIQESVKSNIIYPAMVKNITVYDMNGNIFYDLGYDGFYEEDVTNILNKIQSRAPEDSWTYVRSYRSRDIIVLGRRIINRYNSDETLGYTLISFNENIFPETVLKPIDIIDGSTILYMDYDGTVLSASDTSTALGVPYSDNILFQEIQHHRPAKNDTFDVTINGVHQLISYSYNKSLDQYFVCIIPFSYINSVSAEIYHKILLVLFAILVLCILVTVFIYVSIESPINQMLSACRQIAAGDFSFRMKDQQHDELSILSNSMDHMSDRIQSLLKEQKESAAHKRDLELQMLQYQINPHFLFNTLNSLRFIAQMNQDLVVSDGIRALACLLQNTLVNKNEFIPLKEEIENLKNYFSIQTIRYAGNFQVDYELDESLLDCMIPKLILQPIAENSIMHGSLEDGTPLHIYITCHRRENHLLLLLEDDGRGFDPNHIISKGLHGIGSGNVNDRIELNFGKPFGLTISSHPGEGTHCEFLLPIIFSDYIPVTNNQTSNQNGV